MDKSISSSTTIHCTLCFKTTKRKSSKTSVNCNHLFCSGCAAKLIKDPSRSCPKCRDAIPLPKAPHNKYQESEYMTPLSPKDAVEKASDSDSYVSDVCSIHEQQLDFYCLSCKKKVCSQCLLKEHKIREHDITSVEDFTKEEVEGFVITLNNFQADQTNLNAKLSEASVACAKSEEAVREKIVKKRVVELEKVENTYQSLDNELNSRMKDTMKKISLLNSKNETVLATMKVTRKLCDSVLADLVNNKLDQTSNLDNIRESFVSIENELKSLKSAFVPTTLNLVFKEDTSSAKLGEFSFIRKDDKDEYVNVSKKPKWTVESFIKIKQETPDYASIVCITNGWIVMASSEYGARKVTIEHFGYSKEYDVGQFTRKPCTVDIDDFAWTVGKRAGHDRSILLASGKYIYRISFRKRKEDLVQTFRVEFDIESISWDEFGIDIYVFSRNLRDVHWVTLNGTVTYLCSFQYNVDSVCNFVVGKTKQLSLLDLTNSKIHIFDCIGVKGRQLELSNPFPEDVTVDKSHFSVCSMATSIDHEHHFVMFYQDGLVAVGHFDSSYHFINWVIVELTESSENCLDISVGQSHLALYYDNKIEMYKIKL